MGHTEERHAQQSALVLQLVCYTSTPSLQPQQVLYSFTVFRADPKMRLSFSTARFGCYTSKNFLHALLRKCPQRLLVLQELGVLPTRALFTLSNQTDQRRLKRISGTQIAEAKSRPWQCSKESPAGGRARKVSEGTTYTVGEFGSLTFLLERLVCILAQFHAN